MDKKMKLKMIVKQLAIAGTTIALTGCSLFGPDYKQPVVDTPQTWAHANESGLSDAQSNLSDVSWWEKFNDPVLNDLINQALENNNNIQMAIGNINVASAQLKQVNLAWIPTIDLGGAISTGQALNLTGIPPIGGASVPGTSDFTFYQGGIVPIYSLNIFKQLKQADVAKINLEANKAAKDAVRLTVISQVAGSYFSFLALKEQQEEQKQLIADLTEVSRLTNIQYKNGMATLNDVQQYEVQLQNAKMSLPNIEDNIAHTQNALKVLINKNPGDIIAANKFENIKTTNKIPGNMPSSVLRNRPDILQAEEQLKAANANIAVAYSNYFPSITLTSPVGAFSSQLTSLFNPSGDFWAATVAVNMPILNLGINQLVKKSKAQYYVAYYNYIQTVRNAFAEVDNNLSTYGQLQNKRSSVDKMYTATKLNADLNQKNYKLGYISYPESLASKISLDNNKMIITQTKLQQLQSIVTVYQSMAGGYNYKNTDTAKKFGDDHDM